MSYDRFEVILFCVVGFVFGIPALVFVAGLAWDLWRWVFWVLRIYP